MAKYYGIIGYYFDEKEVEPGIWEPVMEERTAFGDIIKYDKQTENNGSVNDSFKLTNKISFIADPYAMDNFQRIKYATYLGSKWSVKSATVDYPRLILYLGGVYNEKE